MDALLPRQRVFVEAMAEWSPLGGPLLRGEAGALLTPQLGVFGYGQVDRTGPQVGVGARWTW